MKLRHFEAIRPLCAVCREAGEEQPLAVRRVVAQTGDDILEGTLGCTRPSCQREYPILDGVPVLIGALRSYVAQNIFHVIQRDDLSEITDSILGDCCGPGSAFDQTRQHLSSYASGHYADKDPQEDGRAVPPSLLRVLDEGLALAGPPVAGPILDAGCSVGRTTFELAERFDGLVLGIDVNFSMLRLASRALRHGEVRHPRRRVGLVYDQRVFPVHFEHAKNVDFWACDAQALPFPTSTFGLAVSLNLLDCVQSPYEHLAALGRVLRPGASAMVATPYDWSPGATPIEGWIGGHSQRGPEHGSSELALRALLSNGAHPASIPGLELVAEAADLPWIVRIHDRSTMHYSLHLTVARKTG